MPLSTDDDIFKKLMFGVKLKKTKKESQAADERGKHLRIRVLPEGIENLNTTAAVEEEFDDSDGIDILRGHQLTTNETIIEKNNVQNQVTQRAQLIADLRRSNAIFTWGDTIADPLIDWDTSGLPEKLKKNLQEFGITEPSPIQMQSIPIMMEKRDILACAPTGSGKTLAFGVPVVTQVNRLRKMSKYTDGGKLLAIVLEPTRELAVQTYRQFLKFSQGLIVKTSTIDEEEEFLTADVIVSTPKRLLDVLPKLDLRWLRWLVVDESDRLFDNVNNKKGKKDETFRAQLGSIYKMCNGKWARKAFFSATYSQAVEKWCKESIVDLAVVCIGEKNVANSNVEQELIYTGSEQGKLTALRNLFLQKFDPPALIFVQSKDRARQLESWLSSLPLEIPFAILTSECAQAKRDQALNDIRMGKIWILVCTELVGRGLDLPSVNLVVNFDLPTTIVQYIHRIGRTGRAGRKGRAITYFAEGDFKYLRPIANIIHQSGFPVPEYTLTLKPVGRKEKKNIYRHAIKRKNIAAPKRKFSQTKKEKQLPKKKQKSSSS